MLEVVRDIPPGRVASYRTVARLAGWPQAPRQAGLALRRLPGDSDVPWWRVVSAAGRISPRPGDSPELQRLLLEDEGVEFGAGGRVDLGRFGWPGGLAVD